MALFGIVFRKTAKTQYWQYFGKTVLLVVWCCITISSYRGISVPIYWNFSDNPSISEAFLHGKAMLEVCLQMKGLCWDRSPQTLWKSWRSLRWGWVVCSWGCGRGLSWGACLSSGALPWPAQWQWSQETKYQPESKTNNFTTLNTYRACHEKIFWEHKKKKKKRARHLLSFMMHQKFSNQHFPPKQQFSVQPKCFVLRDSSPQN